MIDNNIHRFRKGKKCFVSFKIDYTNTAQPYKTDLTATWQSPQKCSLRFISEIFEVESVKKKKEVSGRQLRY